MKIEKISGLKNHLDAFKSCKDSHGDIFELRDSQDIFHKIVGEPDSFAVLAYLFSRFGAPTIDNTADTKILFEYDFRVDGVLERLFQGVHSRPVRRRLLAALA